MQQRSIASANSDIRGALTSFLDHLSARDGVHRLVHDARFESRYYSSVIVFRVSSGSVESRRFFAKFPKAEMKRGFASLPPREPQDLVLAEREYQAYRELLRSWPRGTTQFIEPVYYDSNSGMLVFEYLEGGDLWSRALVRRAALRRPPSSDWLELIADLGRDLAQYHARCAVPGEFDAETSCRKLQSLLGRVGAPKRRARQLLEGSLGTTLVPGIKGFEVRNARVAERRLYLFDPGHLKLEPPEGDLARFLTSVRMMAWGTPLFTYCIPTTRIEETFLNGYQEIRAVNAELLTHLQERETLKNWISGVRVTELKYLPETLRKALKTTYVDLGYRRLWKSIQQPS